MVHFSVGVFAVTSFAAQFAGRFLGEAPLAWWPVGLLVLACAWGVKGRGAWGTVGAAAWYAAVAVWGAASHAPLPPGALAAARVLPAAPGTVQRKSVLVRAGDRTFLVTQPAFHAFATDAPVRCRAETFLWRDRRCWRVAADGAAPPQGFPRHRAWLAARVGKRLAPWCEALLFGVMDDLSVGAQVALRRFSLLHAVTVSGFHFSALGTLGLFLLTLPLRTLWLSRAVPHRLLVWGHGLALGLTAAGLAAFAAYIAFPPACQRALLVFAVHRGLGLFASGITPRDRMAWTMAGQAAVFPVGFWDVSNVLSWLAYLFVVDHAVQAATHPDGGGFGRLVALQVKLSVACAAVFARWAWVGVVANLALAPLLGPIFLAFVALFAVKVGGAPPWVWQPLEAVLARVPPGLHAASSWVAARGVPDALGLEAWGVWGLQVLTLAFALRAWRRLATAA